MNRKLLVIIVILILLAIPATLMLASGQLFPKEPEPYKVAVVTDTSNIGTIYNRNGVAGVEMATHQSSTPITATLYVADSPTDASFTETYYQALAEDVDLIVVPGFQAHESALAFAQTHPDSSFVSIDGTDIKTYPENYANIGYRSNEPSFVAGYLAGMMTETGTIGFLGGVKIDSVVIFYNGFKAGIDVASAIRDKPLTLIDAYADSFVDEELGYELTSDMYAQGADIVFTVAGDTGLGGIEAAKDMNKYAIGVDVDQNYLAPKNVLCSVVKEIQGVTADVVCDYANGNSVNREQISVGYAEDALGLSSIIDAVPQDLKDQVTLLENSIASGVLTVPKTEDEYASWSTAKAVALLS